MAGLRAALLARVRQVIPDESQRLFALTLVVGAACGLAAVAFHLAIRATEALLIDRALHAAAPAWMFWTAVTPALGGLVAGAALTWIVPGARGSGVPQVKRAFALEGGRVPLRDALGKFALGTLQIGSGASLGREGPTVQICAGAASAVARATSLPPASRRRLTAVGVAAGIAAAFNAPIAAVTFTIEEIVGSLDQTILSGAVVAAAMAAVIERGILGEHPIFEVEQTFGLAHASSLGLYALLGVAAAVVSVAFTDGLLRTRLFFRDLRRIPSWTHPALGGLCTGLVAVGVLHGLGTLGVTGGGYETLEKALAGNLPLWTLLALAGAKVLATISSYSSGGAGGIFAPSLFIGAMLGGAVGHLDVSLLDHEASHRGAFALVGMGAVFAGVIRAPITSVLIIFEMTGGYGLVLPLMLANMTAYILARRWRPMPIYAALLAQDGVSLPTPERTVNPLEAISVSQAMTRAVITAAPGATIAEVLAKVGPRAIDTVPLVGDDGRPLGLVHVDALDEAAREGRGDAPARSLLRPAGQIHADAVLVRALVKMHDRHARQLLAVERGTGVLAGILTTSDVLRAHARMTSPTGLARQTGELSLPGVPPNLTTGDVTWRTPPVGPATRLGDLIDRLMTVPGGALPVELAGGAAGVVTLEAVRDLWRDEHLRALLVAADVATECPILVAESPPVEALAALVASGLPALPVAVGGRLVGLATRAAVEGACRDLARLTPHERNTPDVP